MYGLLPDHPIPAVNGLHDGRLPPQLFVVHIILSTAYYLFMYICVPKENNELNKEDDT